MGVGVGVVYLFVLSIITLGLVCLGYVLGVKSNYSREKLSTYECGFEPLASSRQAFCLRFFILAIIFLVFDVEIALLIPYVLSVSSGVSFGVRVLVFGFVLILLLGLLHEYNEGSLDWML
uniref:NADH-ubiquinone oxidoreductase chain 3 n=1 Tax=Solecurtus divaricatus TaxID=444102 RepID=I6NJD6_9BIVA|nr:NADH dehydrogenase subunit 3 [Solecurtus divaricatus]AEV94329.1 NADH dehydrogenase subunit 3 [Solecurtus divaricatus]